MKITSNSLQWKKWKKAKTTTKKSFLKELTENADLYKPVLNKIMTTHK